MVDLECILICSVWLLHFVIWLVRTLLALLLILQSWFYTVSGIMFQDITTLLLDTKAFRDTIDLFVERYKDKNISVVAGIICFLSIAYVEHY